MSRTPFNASQVRDLLFAQASDVEKMNIFGAAAPADLEATRALIVGLGWGQHKVVIGCAQALGEAQAETAEVAVEGLWPVLNHAYPEVRAEVAESLSKLAFHVEIPLLPLWEAFVGEEDFRAYFCMGRTLLKCLRTQCVAIPPAVGQWLHAFLTDILELRLTTLPLRGAIPQRNEITVVLPEPPPTGVLKRLLGQTPQASVAPPDPAPRPVVLERRRFLAEEEDRYRDVPEVISLLALLYSYVPADPKARLSLILDLCQMPLASFETSEGLVQVAAGLIRDNTEKAALLASMWGWGRSYEPTWTSRLALSAARARPDLRLALFQFLKARQARIDLTIWANSLRDATPIELEPLIAATLAAPESDLAVWMRLLSQAPIEHILPALARALGSSQRDVASDALERLLEHAQPVPWLLNDIGSLRQRWSTEFAMLKGLDTLMSHPRPPTSPDAPLPAGTREPTWIVEWTAEDSAANPFSQGRVLPWREGLQNLNAIYVPGSAELHILSTAVMVSVSRVGERTVRPLPDETQGAGMTLLAAGSGGDLLLAGRGRSQIFLYLLRSGSRELLRLLPGLPADEVPEPRNVMTDGRQFGWAMTLERRSQAGGGLSLRRDVAYCVDPDSATMNPIWPEGMQPVATPKIETADPILSPLAFRFSQCGGFRVCESHGLAIRTGEENPIHSAGRVDGSLALHLEIFPSRLGRAYLWEL